MSRSETLLAYAAAVGPLALLAYALTASPLRDLAPLTHRILYFHVPLAVLAYGCFAVTLAASALYLLRERPRLDALAAASAEVGVLFAVLAIVTGLSWARVDFAAYRPLADPKLVSVIALALVYAGYLALRRGIADPGRRGRVAAVFGLFAFLAVPVAYAASWLEPSVHPRPETVGGIRDRLGTAMLLLLPLAVWFVRARFRILRLEARARGDPL